ncbi:MAG: hypothetical protein HZA59_14270 [Hydrogenophilales bacterium]|nr:hypothetical protein [Hydrogenophilales bacterium]
MNHKYLIGVFLLFISFVAAADSSPLPNGDYKLSGYDADGKKTGGPVKVYVPYSNASFAIGVLCSNKGTVTVTATNETGAETTFKCVIKEQSGS